jgi:hypothetical protein
MGIRLVAETGDMTDSEVSPEGCCSEYCARALLRSVGEYRGVAEFDGLCRPARLSFVF